MSNAPSGSDESELVGLLFDAITGLQEEMPLGDRADIAMACFAAVKQWARKEELMTSEVEPVSSPVIRIHTS